MDETEFIRKGLSFITKAGFTTEKSGEIEKRGKIPYICFSYENIHIAINILYNKEGYYFLDDLKIICDQSFSVFISNKKGDQFSLLDFKEIEKTDITLSNHNHILELEFIQKFISDFQRLIEGKLLPIVEGKIWPKVYFDWKGYK